MPITTGSYPKGLSGGNPKESAAEEAPDAGLYDASAVQDQASDPVLRAQEKGYSQRKAMAAGMIKAT